MIHNSEKSNFWWFIIPKSQFSESQLYWKVEIRNTIYPIDKNSGKLKYRWIKITKIFGFLDRSKNRKTNILVCQNTENKNSHGSKYRKWNDRPKYRKWKFLWVEIPKIQNMFCKRFPDIFLRQNGSV